MLAGCGSSRHNGASTNVASVSPTITPETKVSKERQDNGWWGRAYYDGNPWVTPLSRSNTLTCGLEGRHISLWASHGRYYKIDSGKWVWQRPNLFGTTEDLFTQSFVVPYLIPMLENAGAVVFTPRERDWQVNEVVVDNDSPQIYSCFGNKRSTCKLSDKEEYKEIGKWKTTDSVAFSLPEDGTLRDGDEPFRTGTARMANTTKGVATSFAEYTPDIKEPGDYAVYVSYQTVDESIDDAHYTVFHSGVQTEFRVNQQMGGGTWVYLGTFHLNNDPNQENCVVLDNHSEYGGKVTTDAVRFGGGMGNVLRGDSMLTISGLPRSDEGARYYCEWAGAPYGVYSQRGGTDDYADDINCRSMMTNWLAGGSCYEPDTVGQCVPIELCLALHSDAGFNRDFSSIYGSLGICTTDFNNGKLAAGHPRSHSRELVDSLLNSVDRDLKSTYGKWNVRDVYDRNYSETRRPEMPSAILETLSHQSFPDMKMAHDPQFKFVLARSVYKAILRYIAHAHGKQYVVEPLAPVNFKSSLSNDGRLTLSWEAQIDSLEPTAVAKAFKIYMAKGDEDYDNGEVVSSDSVAVTLEEGRVYRFRVSAINEGGESFRSEELAAVYRAGKPVVLVANGFHRLASPQVVDSLSADSKMLGFDISADPGLSYGKTPVWSGNQQVYDTLKANGEGPGTFGYCGSEMAGSFVAGNDFNHVASHVSAIASTCAFSAVSCSANTLPLYGSMCEYAALDVLLGNERNDGYSLTPAKALPKYLRNAITHFQGGVFVSGSYLASDAANDDEKAFLKNTLHVALKTKNVDGQSLIHGMGKNFDVYRSVNSEHFASTSSDVLSPVGGAFATLAYTDGSSAAVAYGNRLFVMGFPFECIKSENDRNAIMGGIMQYITNSSK